MADSLIIAVLSGKGGTGKTLVSVNLAAMVQRGTYIDCDVEDPNGYLFLKPTIFSEDVITVGKPEVDNSLCDGCKICSDACAFKALAVVKKKLLIFEEICHSCGLCYDLCPQGALTEVQRPLGTLRRGRHNDLLVLDAEMKIGEPSGVPLIEALIKEIRRGVTIIDSPPGTGCLVHETIAAADFCLLVAEPTIFGAQNLEMVHQLATLMEKPSAVLLNKCDGSYNPSEEYAIAHDLPIISRLPWDDDLARLSSDGEIASEVDGRYRAYFIELLEAIIGEARNA